MAKKLKVTLVGAASPMWGWTLNRDIIVTLSHEKFADYDIEYVLEDVDPVNLAVQEVLARKILKRMKSKIKVWKTLDQRRAISDADFVIPSIAQGQLDAMKFDLEIPYEYGIFQPVGDSISVGGAIRACRNIPALLSMAKDMQEVAKPGAWMINLTNPMSMLCRAVTKETPVKVIGLCHEIYGGIGTLSQWLGFSNSTWKRHLEIEALGINHCGWMQSLKIDGKDGFAMLRAFLKKNGITKEVKRLYDSAHPELRRQNVKIDLFLRYGVFPYSGDRHTSEFFKEFVNWGTNKGADYGVLLTSIQDRYLEHRGQLREWVYQLIRGEAKIKYSVSQEASSRIIRAIVLNEKFYDIGNLPYYGTSLPGMVNGAVLERMTTYDGAGAHPDPVKPLPEKPYKHLLLHAHNIEGIVESAVTGDRKLLISTLECDPLLQNMKKAKIKEMVGRLLAVHRKWVHKGFF